MDVKIKICGITNFDDALAATEAGADALGFMFFENSPRYIPIEDAAEVIHRVSPFVIKVGVFVNPDRHTVLSAIATCGLNVLQFHGEETPEFCAEFGMMTIKAFRMRDERSLGELSPYGTDAFLLDSYVAGKQGGTGERFNWELAIAAKKFGKPIFLAGGLNPSNVADAVRQVQPYAVDVSSGVEAAPGRKDPDKIRAFVAAVQKATAPA